MPHLLYCNKIICPEKFFQIALADLVGVLRNIVSPIETRQFTPAARRALLLCVAVDKKFEDFFYFWDEHGNLSEFKDISGSVAFYV